MERGSLSLPSWFGASSYVARVGASGKSDARVAESLAEERMARSMYTNLSQECALTMIVGSRRPYESVSEVNSSPPKKGSEWRMCARKIIGDAEVIKKKMLSRDT